MKTNYRIQNACPNCKFSITSYDSDFYCNKDGNYNPELSIMNDGDVDTIYDWEGSHWVSWCGICIEYKEKL